MKKGLFIIGLFISFFSFSQGSQPPMEVTSGLQIKIRQGIEKEITGFRQKLLKDKENAVHIEFAVDTFRVERFMVKCTEIDYSDFGMREATNAGSALYDSLLNKYYKKLSAVLKDDDKKALVQAQRAWLAFRDNEMKLVETISKDQYSGGGTIQQLTEASEYLNLVKERTIVLFEHYVRATQNE
ncbi:MAG TPA: lysozyme inhibitor LprI family protein [Flavisolibacter sp.]|nr:lysozyme inhibitor LprI family protein [Flavisolibacter sp.]